MNCWFDVDCPNALMSRSSASKGREEQQVGFREEPARAQLQTACFGRSPARTTQPAAIREPYRSRTPPFLVVRSPEVAAISHVPG